MCAGAQGRRVRRGECRRPCRLERQGHVTQGHVSVVTGGRTVTVESGARLLCGDRVKEEQPGAGVAAPGGGLRCRAALGRTPGLFV